MYVLKPGVSPTLFRRTITLTLLLACLAVVAAILITRHHYQQQIDEMRIEPPEMIWTADGLDRGLLVAIGAGVIGLVAIPRR